MSGNTNEKVTRFRWFVLALVFVVFTLVYADRANIGFLLPLIKEEFKLSNFVTGSLASLFFLGYAVTQIPAGFLYRKFGERRILPLAVLATSAFTGLIGTASSALLIQIYRVGLGLAEGAVPIGMGSTINKWFPAKEKGTASGVYLASTKIAPAVVGPLCAFILSFGGGWRSVFMWFAIPGIALAVIWYYFVHSQPTESPYCSRKEAEYINNTQADVSTSQEKNTRKHLSLGWIDKVIRAKHMEPLSSSSQIFRSWNIWGATLGCFCTLNVVLGLLTWLPTYLLTVKGFSFMKMGFVASAPWVGAVLGATVGGWLSDHVFNERRKPLIIIGTIATAAMMLFLINLPNDPVLISIILFITGFIVYVGYSGFITYPMSITTKDVYPVAYGCVNSGGNLGGFFSPMIIGFLLDVYNFDVVFMFLAASSILSLLFVLTLDERI